MNPKVKAKWLAALRSGEYKQGTGVLRTDYTGEDKFCCLGVLCDLAVQEGVTTLTRTNGGVYSYAQDGGGLGVTGTLPKVVREWAEVTTDNPLVKWKSGNRYAHYSLTQLNDREGLSFDEIADVIEDSL